jgi:outer membrane protein OmpA-like peptidoglycan-associated protein
MALCLLAPGAQAQGKAQELPYLTVMPNYQQASDNDKQFDEHKFCDGKRLHAVEGRYWWREYSLKEGAQQASPIQITRNYGNALKNQGGTVLFDGESVGEGCEGVNVCARLLTAKLARADGELWVEVGPCDDGMTYIVVMVEKEAMKQDVTANAMLDALNRDGHVALYINFDTGKATIRPDSKPIVDQIVQLMKSNPSLKLTVEGHTDTVGNPKSNKALSEERAKSVVAELVKNGIDGKRLGAVGHGQDKPVADNATEAGRARNRRVELVRK